MSFETGRLLLWALVFTDAGQHTSLSLSLFVQFIYAGFGFIGE